MTKDLGTLVAEGAFILDVRSQGEFEEVAFPGSTNIPLTQLSKKLPGLEAHKDKPVIVYCASGSRSSEAAQVLKNAGWTKVYDAGGLGNMPFPR